MSAPTLEELSATVATLRAELDDVKAQLKDLSRAVQIDYDNGPRRVTLVCHGINVRTREKDSALAIRIGCSGRRGHIWFQHPGEDKGDIALSLGINEDDQAAIRLIGQDHQDRLFLTVENDHGLVACLGPGYTPGSVMRAIPGGGSFGVLQPDGKARGVLMHSDGSARPGGHPATELIFATPDAKTMLTLRADDRGSMIVLSQPDAPNCATLVAHGGSASLVVHGGNEATTAMVFAAPSLARISTYIGKENTHRGEAGLSSSPGGASLTLRRPDAATGLEATAAETTTWLSLRDRAGLEAIGLSESEGLHSLNIHVPGSNTKAHTLASTADTAHASICCPGNEQRQLFTRATGATVIHAIMDGPRPLVALTHSENGGSVAAYGSHENPGVAALHGNHATACLSVSSADGTTLAGLSATDHGGHFTLNNDLGFPRITMGIFQESSALTLNHTGQKGVEAFAGPGGGVLLVHDQDGRVAESLTGFDDDDSDS